MKKIAVVTTSRADYSLLYWPLRDLAAHPEVDLKIIALGPRGNQRGHLECLGVMQDHALHELDVGVSRRSGRAVPRDRDYRQHCLRTLTSIAP